MAAGSTTGGPWMIVARYNTDGSLDSSFGTGGLFVLTNPAGATSVAIQPDGKIVIGGSFSRFPVDSGDFAVVRLSTNGSLDSSFGVGGIVSTELSGFIDLVYAIAIQSDGKIVAGGLTTVFTGEFLSDFALVRYNTDGTLDTSFGTGGIVTNDFGTRDRVTAVAIQIDGKIVAGGHNGEPDGDFALARYNTDGSLDTSFGIGGLVTTDFDSAQDGLTAVAIQSDGKIVAAGLAEVGSFRFALARYNSDGSLDSSFGTGGLVTTDFGFSYANGVVIQADGKIVAAGRESNDFALARYNTDGSLDSSFGTGGLVITVYPFQQDALAVALQPDGNIVIAGKFDTNGQGFLDLALARYLSSSFCGDGFVEGVEECDDGNPDDGDGCSSTCMVEPGCECTGEPSVCTCCGDGIVEGSEECDDGNPDDEDGCSSTCIVEDGWSCTGEPSVCTTCGQGALGITNLNTGAQYCLIQAAIDAASNGDVIEVAPGTYNETINFIGKAITLRSSSGADVTIIDATGLNNSVVKCISSEGPDTLLDGFTITGGNAIGTPFPENIGGGMCNIGSSPTVTNCTFTGNNAAEGGGMANYLSSNPTVADCVFSDNVAANGGGMANRASSNATITYCAFSGNTASAWGGGMDIDGSDPTVTNCTFTGNNATCGGGMEIEFDSNPVVTNCTFVRNAATCGGGIDNDEGSPLIANCALSGNSAQFGGGITDWDFARIVNSTFVGNTATTMGGAIYGGNLVTNCSFTRNTSDDVGGAMYITHSYATVANCILWNNADSGGMDESAQIHVASGTPEVNFSDVQGGWTGAGGVGNISTDPMFVRNADPGLDGQWDGVNDDYGDLHLSFGSPCIDAANNTAVPPDIADLDGDGGTTEPTPFDLDGKPRFVDDPNTVDCPQPGANCGTPPIVDMGAYEYQGSAEPIPTVSEWGMAVMTLLLLTAGTLVVTRGCAPSRELRS